MAFSWDYIDKELERVSTVSAEERERAELQLWLNSAATAGGTAQKEAPVGKIGFQVRYQAGHSSPEEWIATSLFCPFCAAQSIWLGGGDDYYEGQAHICLSCEMKFWLPSHEQAKSFQDFQRLIKIGRERTA